MKSLFSVVLWSLDACYIVIYDVPVVNYQSIQQIWAWGNKFCLMSWLPVPRLSTSSRPLLFYPVRLLAFCGSAGSQADAVRVLTAALQLMSADLINLAKFLLSSISFGNKVLLGDFIGVKSFILNILVNQNEVFVSA